MSVTRSLPAIVNRGGDLKFWLHGMAVALHIGCPPFCCWIRSTTWYTMTSRRVEPCHMPIPDKLCSV